jgi:hypothetical protein
VCRCVVIESVRSSKESFLPIGIYIYLNPSAYKAINGYFTEKIINPVLAGAVPIYWGAPDVEKVSGLQVQPVQTVF